MRSISSDDKVILYWDRKLKIRWFVLKGFTFHKIIQVSDPCRSVVSNINRRYDIQAAANSLFHESRIYEKYLSLLSQQTKLSFRARKWGKHQPDTVKSCTDMFFILRNPACKWTFRLFKIQLFPWECNWNTCHGRKKLHFDQCQI